jgi:TM2 domain-containing membrane protein YozV
MIGFNYRWWVWILIILVIYITVKSPSTTEFLFGGVVHAFAAVGNAILHMIADLRSPAH